MKRALSLGLTAIFLCTLFLSFCVHGENLLSTGCIIDPDNLLTDDEEGRITLDFRRAEQNADGCRLVLYYYLFKGSYIDETDFNRHGIYENGTPVIVFEITKETDEYTYEIHTFGKDYRRVTSAEYNRMNNAVKSSVKAGDIVSACAIFAPLAAESFAQDYTNWGTVFLVSALVSFFITLIIGIVIVVRYKKKLKSEIYPLSRFANMNLTGQSDVLIGTVVTKRRVSNSSSSGGGGGMGGGGGGGHSSGGRH